MDNIYFKQFKNKFFETFLTVLRKPVCLNRFGDRFHHRLSLTEIAYIRKRLKYCLLKQCMKYRISFIIANNFEIPFLSHLSFHGICGTEQEIVRQVVRRLVIAV